MVRAKGRAVGRRSDGAAGPVSSLIGSPNHSKKLPVLIFFFCWLFYELYKYLTEFTMFSKRLTSG